MSFIADIIPYAQIAISVLLVIAIILQQNSAGLGEAFGSSDSVSSWHTRRGFEKTLFVSTIVLAVLFALSALISILIN
jgi:protein translocase, SecG subunit